MSRYFYDKKEDIPKESLNKYQNLFVEYIKSVPSLTEALNQMFSSMAIPEKKINELTEYIISKSENNIKSRNMYKVNNPQNKSEYQKKVLNIIKSNRDYNKKNLNKEFYIKRQLRLKRKKIKILQFL